MLPCQTTNRNFFLRPTNSASYDRFCILIVLLAMKRVRWWYPHNIYIVFLFCRWQSILFIRSNLKFSVSPLRRFMQTSARRMQYSLYTSCKQCHWLFMAFSWSRDLNHCTLRLVRRTVFTNIIKYVISLVWVCLLKEYTARFHEAISHVAKLGCFPHQLFLPP